MCEQIGCRKRFRTGASFLESCAPAARRSGTPTESVTGAKAGAYSITGAESTGTPTRVIHRGRALGRFIRACERIKRAHCQRKSASSEQAPPSEAGGAEAKQAIEQQARDQRDIRTKKRVREARKAGGRVSKIGITEAAAGEAGTSEICLRSPRRKRRER